jgi:hypothetical protein
VKHAGEQSLIGTITSSVRSFTKPYVISGAVMKTFHPVAGQHESPERGYGSLGKRQSVFVPLLQLKADSGGISEENE